MKLEKGAAWRKARDSGLPRSKPQEATAAHRALAKAQSKQSLHPGEVGPFEAASQLILAYNVRFFAMFPVFPAPLHGDGILDDQP